MQWDANGSSSSASSSSAPFGGWPSFPSAHATSPAFNSFGQPQQQQQPQHGFQHQQQQQPAQGFPSLKRSRSNDGSAPEPSAKRPQFQHHAASAPFLPQFGLDPQAQLLAYAEHLRLNSPLQTPPVGQPAASFLEQQHQQQLQQHLQQQQQQQQFLQQQQHGAAALPEAVRMEDMGAGVSFMGYAAHELHGGGGMDDGDDDDMDDDCTNPMPWGSSHSTHFPENADDDLMGANGPGRAARPTQTHALPAGFPSQTPASTPHHSPHQGFAPLPPAAGPISPLSHAPTYNYGAPRPLQPPTPKAAGAGAGYTMGPRADCEKCRLGVKGHYGHIGSGGR